MATEQVQQLAEDVKKLSPTGQSIIKAFIGVSGGGETAETEVELGKDGSISSFLDLQGLIKNHADGIEKLKNEIKTTNEMFQDSFNNNPTYREHADKVKEASKAKASVKMQIRKQPSVANLEQKLKDMKFDLNEKKKTMSDLLVDYKEQTGATQLELFDGRTMEIVQSAKLVRAK